MNLSGEAGEITEIKLDVNKSTINKTLYDRYYGFSQLYEEEYYQDFVNNLAQENIKLKTIKCNDIQFGRVEGSNQMAKVENQQLGGNSGEMPEGDMPSGGMPGGDMPTGGMPGGDMPSGGMPGGDMPSGGMQGGDVPSGEMPGGDMPSGGMPGGDNQGNPQIPPQ